MSVVGYVQGRYVRGRVLWQPDAADADRVLPGLARLAEITGCLAVLIPTTPVAPGRGPTEATEPGTSG